jgi:hypothetical protein
MKWHDLVNACAAIHRLVKGRGWGVQPLLILRFPTIEEYAQAKADLIRAAAVEGHFLPVNPHRESIDIYGVEFVLECTQMVTFPDTNMSAVQALAQGRIKIRGFDQ